MKNAKHRLKIDMEQMKEELGKIISNINENDYCDVSINFNKFIDNKKFDVSYTIELYKDYDEPDSEEED